jgi:hypothetical protein
MRIKAGMIRMCRRHAWGSDADALDEAAEVIERLTRERDEAVLVMADGIYEAALAGQTGIREHGLALTVERLRTAAARIAKLEAALRDAEKRLRGAGMLGGSDDPIVAAIRALKEPTHD